MNLGVDVHVLSYLAKKVSISKNDKMVYLETCSIMSRLISLTNIMNLYKVIVLMLPSISTIVMFLLFLYIMLE